MRILLTNNHLCTPGGSERWTETMFHALTALGHEVDIFTFTENRLFSARPYSPDAAGSRRYDLALINHNTCLRFLRGAKNIRRIIFTSHGVLPPLERAEAGADVYVGVSEEVCEAMPFPAVCIRNPIDLNAFRKTEPLQKTPRILFLAMKHGRALRTVQSACDGLSLEVVGQGNPIDDVPTAINRADLVVGLGRCAYEAMACGRNVVVYGYNGGDGFLTPEVFPLWRRRNLSGRTRKRQFTATELRAEIDRYDSELDLRPLVAGQCAADIAREYLTL